MDRSLKGALDLREVKSGLSGSGLRMTKTDLPLKVRETVIVVLKDLSVLQCGSCSQYLLEDSALRRVDEMLTRAGGRRF